MFKRLVMIAQIQTLRSLYERLVDSGRSAVGRRKSVTVTRVGQCDIVASLPEHLAKKVLANLEYNEVEVVSNVSQAWHRICLGVLNEKVQRQDADDFVLDLQVSAWVVPQQY